MDARTRFETRVVGALPMLLAFLEELEVAKTIDELVPWEGEVALGTLVEILMLNRLLSPKPLFRVGEWASQASVTEYDGLAEEQLNDDRLGRALERLNKYRVSVQAGLVANAVKKYRLDVKRIHYDISNAELFGNYERQLEKMAAQADSEQGGRRVGDRRGSRRGPSAGIWPNEEWAEERQADSIWHQRGSRRRGAGRFAAARWQHGGSEHSSEESEAAGRASSALARGPCRRHEA